MEVGVNIVVTVFINALVLVDLFLSMHLY